MNIDKLSKQAIERIDSMSIDELRSKFMEHGYVPINKWKPISTAPEDRRILLFYPVSVRKHGPIRGGIVEAHQEVNTYNELTTLIYQPTHWMELPEMPKEPESKDGI